MDYGRERDAIITKLESLSNCKRFKEENRELFADVIAHLKRGFPRILTEQEAITWCKTPADQRTPVFEEYKPGVLPEGVEERHEIDPRNEDYIFSPNATSILLPGYGHIRRWWSMNPGAWAMSATPWDTE